MRLIHGLSSVSGLNGALLLGASLSATAQSIQAPPIARAPSSTNAPFALLLGGALADIGLAKRIAEFEPAPPVVTRGADDAGLEQLFATRCRSVVLVVSVNQNHRPTLNTLGTYDFRAEHEGGE